ncbi:26s proteasome regulatory subunit [Cystoisospora suis]|uniref:26s proteasome regulatory subunit n=1 Tax=Cystoisospora suis TaxID=483139 RepID=A0A2C6L2A5_9APIC|nr:26s proteasome regulatory subunit [Cystoisospora suis]
MRTYLIQGTTRPPRNQNLSFLSLSLSLGFLLSLVGFLRLFLFSVLYILFLLQDHFLQYADLPQRRAVPLALALHSPSRAKPGIIDTLSKLSHDVDAEVALNAIFAMGIVGAGTNNARIAALLRSLASYYCKDSNALFVIRLAQGLLYMGKGLLTINPLHSDRFLIHNVTLGCLCVILHTCLHMRHTILR